MRVKLILIKTSFMLKTLCFIHTQTLFENKQEKLLNKLQKGE